MISYAGTFKATRDKNKKKYKVYARIRYIYNGMGIDSETIEYIGETMAVSATKAVNNIAYRLRIKPYDLIPLWGDGAKETNLFAEVDEENDNLGGYATASREAR